MPNAYIEEATKQKPVVAIIRPAKKESDQMAARFSIAEMFAGGQSPERMAALEVAKQYPRASVINAKDTPSMLGVGYKNDLVLAPMDDYQPGDDVVYRSPGGGMVLHRITHKKPGEYFLKGTFNQNGDGWVAADRIVGKIVHPKPKW